MTSLGSDCFANCDKLETIYCYATNPPAITYGSGYNLGLTNACIIYVPGSSVDKYKQAEGWKEYTWILPIKGTRENTGEDTKGKCEKPVITYSDGKLHFESATIGAEYHYTLNCNDVVSLKYSNDGDIKLAAAYNITVYATADDYTASDKATATLYWINGRLDDPTNINNAKTRGILASSQDGIVSVSGLNEGESVAFYSVDGKLLGNAKAVNGVASYAVSNASVVIAKIGDQSIKLVVR